MRNLPSKYPVRTVGTVHISLLLSCAADDGFSLSFVFRAAIKSVQLCSRLSLQGSIAERVYTVFCAGGDASCVNVTVATLNSADFPLLSVYFLQRIALQLRKRLIVIMLEYHARVCNVMLAVFSLHNGQCPSH